MSITCETCGASLIGVAYMTEGALYCEADILVLTDKKSYKVKIGEERLVKRQDIELLERRGKHRGPKP